jgi:hypothetical protein
MTSIDGNGTRNLSFLIDVSKEHGKRQWVDLRGTSDNRGGMSFIPFSSYQKKDKTAWGFVRIER